MVGAAGRDGTVGVQFIYGAGLLSSTGKIFRTGQYGKVQMFFSSRQDGTVKYCFFPYETGRYIQMVSAGRGLRFTTGCTADGFLT